ncbi:MAG: hypothetical protein IT436_06470 [Phycisphaerales bacterium]|nr:hypothetical protein [Phycisphaerales bacterium]
MHKQLTMVIMAGVAPWAGPGFAQCTPPPPARLLAPLGAAQDRFGSSVGMSGDVVVVGAYADDGAFPDSGTAHVYRWNGAVWSHEATLAAPDAALADQFGSSVAVSGDLIAVGSQWDDDRGIDSGSVYLFRYNGVSWDFEVKLSAADGQPVDQFGFSVSVLARAGGDDLLMVGAITDDELGADSGSAYIFRRVGGTWVQETKIVPLDLHANDRTGASVSITAGPGGEFALVTSWLQDDLVRGVDSGSTYVYRFDGSAWVQDGKLAAPDGAAFDWFGISGAIGSGISGEYAAVGAIYRDDAGVDSGAVYVYRRQGGVWEYDAKLIGDTVTANDNFGRSVAILPRSAGGAPDTDIIAAGSRFDDPGSISNAGTVTVFRRRGTGWSQDAVLNPDPAATDQETGTSVGLSVDGAGQIRAITGAPRDSTQAANAGAAFVFPLPCTAICAADMNADGLIDFSDYLIFLNLYDAADLRADLNGDSLVDFSDYLEFLNRYDAGC